MSDMDDPFAFLNEPAPWIVYCHSLGFPLQSNGEESALFDRWGERLPSCTFDATKTYVSKFNAHRSLCIQNIAFVRDTSYQNIFTLFKENHMSRQGDKNGYEEWISKTWVLGIDVHLAKSLELQKETTDI